MLPARFDRLVPLEAASTAFGPGALALARHAPGIHALAAGPCSTRRLGRLGLPDPLHPVPVDGQGLAGLVRRVEHVQARSPGAAGPRGAVAPVAPGDPRLQARPASAMTYCSASQPRNASAQVAPVRRSAFWPRNQVMLAGSTPTSTGRPWKKISSRQPTRTNARHRASRGQDPAGRHAGGLDPAVDRGPRGGPLGPRSRASRTRTWLRLSPIAAAVTANSLLLARGELDGLSRASPRVRHSRRRRGRFSSINCSRVGPSVLGLDGGLDLVGMIVDGLSAAVGDVPGWRRRRGCR